MWAVLASWITVAVVVPVLVGIGVGVLSMTPPDHRIAYICFTLAALILLIRTGWWLAFEQSKFTYSVIFFAFGIFGFIGSLWFVSIKWVSGLEQSERLKHEVSVSPLEITVKHQTNKDFTLKVMNNKDVTL